MGVTLLCPCPCGLGICRLPPGRRGLGTWADFSCRGVAGRMWTCAQELQVLRLLHTTTAVALAPRLRLLPSYWLLKVLAWARVRQPRGCHHLMPCIPDLAPHQGSSLHLCPAVPCSLPHQPCSPANLCPPAPHSPLPAQRACCGFLEAVPGSSVQALSC